MDRSPFELGSSYTDLLGWCLACGLFGFAMIGPLRRDPRAAQAYLLAVFLHIAAAAIYIYVPDVLPIRNDSHVFHRYAALRQWMVNSPFAIGSRFFEEYLAVVYSLVGPSFFLASVLSIYAFALSVLVLVRFMELLEVRRGKGMIILLFGALPTAVLYGSVPMREPYQILFFMLACYSMLRFRMTNQPLHLAAAIVFALLMGMLHKGLILYAPFLITMMLLVRVDHPHSRAAGRLYFHRFAAAALAIGFVVWISGAAQKLQGIAGTEVLLSATTGDGLVEFATEHRDEEALSKGRTAYGVALNTSSPVHFLYSSAMVFLYYMLAPFPWQIGNSLDVYAFGEAVLRVVCLIVIFQMWRRGGPVHSQILTLLMVVYFSMAFLWAGGTTNWGTATRHHMMHQWILLLLGVPALMRTASVFGRGHPGAREARVANDSAPRVGRPEPVNPSHGGFVNASSRSPRLLRAAACQPKRLQAAHAPPQGLSRDLGRNSRPPRL